MIDQLSNKSDQATRQVQDIACKALEFSVHKNVVVSAGIMEAEKNRLATKS